MAHHIVTKCQIAFTRRAVLFIKFISCVEVSNRWCRETSHVSIYFAVFCDVITDWRHVNFLTASQKILSLFNTAISHGRTCAY